MKKILVLGQTPPPFGGQALMIRRLLDGSYPSATLYHVRMSFAKDMDDLGKFRPAKLIQLFAIILKTVYLKLRHGIDILYYPPSGPDLVPMLRDMAILLSTRWMFKKTIFHFHAAGASQMYPHLPCYLRLLYRLSFFRPDLAIQLSSFNPDDGALIQAKQMEIVPNGIEDAFLAMGSPAKPEHSVCKVLFVGLIRESKGVLVLIDAINIIKIKGKSVKVTFVGKFASNAIRQLIVQKIADYDLTEYFEFTGVLTGRAKFEQYVDADIFCFPTFFESESFGLVVIEAMQFCVPVIATRWRGTQSLFNDGEEGVLVPIRDSDALAEQILLLLENPQLRLKLGHAGRERFLQDYTVEQFCRRMDACFSKL